ncbi:metallo-beta-lactamase family protein [Fulvimarina pelagi HTCC2506]|uniref:Metallo-beta-lactamase family protein n=2 Tax=Fulvimarina pelagi TaxID=217511 RepID=Q0G0G6_9HYPH|nr:MBL fold metallo-hydrolase [Fulvimarina pelagi]EAU40627.1 metallo-beta-lactamase family protein [Fulvimarina pelagi HTCC2506]BAT31172.1 metallo-beta-lactamase family protein [Fulvimarina pelagi]
MSERPAIELPEGVLRVTADNSGPMTFRGTNTYVVGYGDTCCVIDPGPEDAFHLEAIVEAVGARQVEAVMLTHRHRDHSGLVRKAKERFGAPLFAAPSPAVAYQASVDFAALESDRSLIDGGSLQIAGHRIEVVATPGHTSDHLAFALPEHGVLFTGDHVMGWSTTVVIPPDGSMRRYRESLKKLVPRDERLYLPGHGDPIERPERLVRNFLHHRRQREEMILLSLQEAPVTITGLVERHYPAVEGALAVAAGYSVKAHLVELFERGTLAGPDPLVSDGPFELA